MGVIQVSRIITWQRQVKNGTVSELVQQDAKDAARTAKGDITENPEAASKSAIQ